MKNLKYRFVLPAVQLVISCLLFWYSSYQWRATIRGHVIGLDFYFEHYPPPAQRTLYALNFPAFVVADATSMSERLRALFRYSLFHWSPDGDGVFHFTLSDAVFFLAVVLLWYFLGHQLDRKFGTLQQSRQVVRFSSFVLPIALLAYAVVVCVYGIHASFDPYIPFRQIGPFGVLWAVLLGSCSISLMRQKLRSVVSPPELDGHKL